MQIKTYARQATTHWHAVALAVAFVSLFYWLNSQAYLAFQVQAPDADRFSQAIWLTLKGEFLYSTILEGSILQHHFTPYMALLSPLLLIWEDIRILYLVQLLGFAVGGLLLYAIAQKHNKLAALLLLAAFFLNHNLHQIALHELRRITLAFPYLSLMAYALNVKDRRLLLFGSVMALLCKENVGLIVSGVGLFLLLRERDWVWGSLMLFGGAAWLLLMLEWIIPALGQGFYLQTNYFAAWGDNMPQVIVNIATQPRRVLAVMFDTTSITAIWRTLLPFAIIIPALGFDYLLISLPLLGVMLLGTEPELHGLQRWYLASILPFLFASVMVAATRLSKQRATVMAGIVMVCTLWMYWQHSPAPLGKQFAAYRYQVTERERVGWEILEMIPDDASVRAQVAFTVPLSHRHELYLYPHGTKKNADYIVLGERYNAYPLEPQVVHDEIVNLLVDPTNLIVAEADGMILFKTNEDVHEGIDIGRSVENSILLERIELAKADPSQLFQTQPPIPKNLKPGQTLRVSLFWRALATSNAERTVSLRLADSSGAIIAQHDGLPAEATRPTSWWKEGWHLREVRYLNIPDEAQSGKVTLDVVLYDSFSQEQLAFDNGDIVLTLADLIIAP